MTSVQLLAFVVLPMVVAAVGWVVAFVSNPPKEFLRARVRRETLSDTHDTHNA